MLAGQAAEGREGTRKPGLQAQKMDVREQGRKRRRLLDPERLPGRGSKGASRKGDKGT